jgi:hypothetical protein
MKILKRFKKHQTPTLVVLLMIAIILSVTAVAASYYLSSRENQTTTQEKKANQNNLRKYTDPDGYFNVDILSNWTVEKSTGTGTTDIGTVNQKTHIIEYINITLSAYKTITIQVYEDEQKCINIKWKNNTTLGGLPAYYDKTLYTWYLETTNAEYIINYGWYPYVGRFNGPAIKVGQPTNMPISQEKINEYKKQVTMVINSFRPINTQALNCK